MIFQADSRHIPLEDKSVNCIITSPPYWSLRKYDIPDLVWDSVEGCEHEWGNEYLGDTRPYGAGQGKWQHGQDKVEYGRPHIKVSQGQFCLHCSAWRGQLGLEPTIDLYLKHLMQIMDECKRVLRDDGTMWVNIGDSYNSNATGPNPGGFQGKADSVIAHPRQAGSGRPGKSKTLDIPVKSLCLIPERFAIEMVNSNWELREDLTEEERKYVLTELINRGII